MQSPEGTLSHGPAHVYSCLPYFFTFAFCRFDGKFAHALKEYSELGSKKDGVSVNVGDMELHEFTKLLEIAAEGLKRYMIIFLNLCLKYG